MKRSIGIAATATVLLGLVIVGGAWAAEFKDLSAHDLKAKMDGDETVLVINPLSDIEFAEGHIPGSVNIPIHMIPSSGRLPSDKSVPIVTYCLGPK